MILLEAGAVDTTPSMLVFLGSTTEAGIETAIAVSQTYSKVISTFAELGMVTL
ncbi:hypothetical protein [Acaryochloris sp. CCMEE 5410]|uniref:hypothetical protein n=1 Tax=Acaryochloris sp. CCMEE 5410 TaxID=310037 RepID=UPI0003175538|nr:hypothetical protein [Acaryochloris sp. CCMEE 5410]KAI9131959.1 hypothetical protein ON05_029880 [Acaryochloris sp. CCMEE 5410]